jgi:hypothetical protein
MGFTFTVQGESEIKRSNVICVSTFAYTPDIACVPLDKKIQGFKFGDLGGQPSGTLSSEI